MNDTLMKLLNKMFQLRTKSSTTKIVRKNGTEEGRKEKKERHKQFN